MGMSLVCDEGEVMIRVLDLFCGGGGASVGMMRAGAQVVGLDIEPQPEHPGYGNFLDLIQGDALSLSVDFIRKFDFVWASPPCQAYSWASAGARNSGRDWPDLVSKVRDLLSLVGVPFCIENVAGSPIRHDLMLCGDMFGLKVIRHRYFEIHGFETLQPDHWKHRGKVQDGFYVTVAGHNCFGLQNFRNRNNLPGANGLEVCQYAMGIGWIQNKKTLREVVPPAYSEYIMRQFIGGG